MRDSYLIDDIQKRRLPTVEDALAWRDELQKGPLGELINFSYTQKVIKAKGEVVEEYVLAKATIKFNEEKDPEYDVEVIYSDGAF